jgi:phosphonate transport system substrate-binding protein
MSAHAERVRALRNRNRRRFVVALAGAATAVARARSADAPLRFATTPVFLDDQIGLLAVWQRYLSARLARPVVFVQRGSYREIVDLLLGDGVEAAWLCGHPFVLYEQRLALVGVPRYQGAPLYRSHLIVPVQDASTARIADLRDRVFAYSDPLSNSGYLVPRAELLQGGVNPQRFFKRSFFTFSHRKVVEAVRAGLADAGAVDGYVWDTLHAQQPDVVAGVRVAWRSAPHGFPPVVARASWAATERQALAEALMGMSQSAPGRELLARLNLDAFEPANAAQFTSIRTLLRLHESAGP